MTQHLTIASLSGRSPRRQLLSRRQVMIGAAGLSFAIAVGVDRRAAAAVLAGEQAGKALGPWVSIAGDGTITIMSPATEMGQGSMTSLPLIIAEELDADWSKVRIVPAPVIEAIYGNPGFGGMMYTAGSNAVTSYYRPLRMFGAEVRRVLIDNAAKKLDVPAEELTTEPSAVVHAKSGRKLSYGEIAAFAEVPDKAPEVKPEALKKPSEFRLIGKDVPRVDVSGKVNGSARYAIDVQVPNMLYGAVLRAPVEGSVPDKIDDAKAKVIAGPVRIVRLPYGVGVLAETPWAAFEAHRALAQSVTWSRTGTAWGFDSDKGMERFAADARDPARGATEWSKVGDARGEIPKASSVFEAEYRCDYAYHAQMEPLNAIASVSPSGDAVEIWAGTQSQSIACEAPAKVLGIARDKVKLHDMLMSGGKDFIAMLGGEPRGYDVPHQLVEQLYRDTGVRTNPLRGISFTANKFAAETFIDEIAVKRGVDPLKFRLELLKNTPRAVKVVERVAEMENWGTKREGRGFGFAFLDYSGSQVAGIAEVSVDRASGQIKVHNFWCTIDCGVAVQPDNVAAQSESSIVYGLGLALIERITVKNGAVEQSNFYDYRVPRMNEVPLMHVEVIPTDNHPTGVGQMATPLIAPAISGAVMQLTGVRLRHTPFTPERVKAALG